MSRAILWNSSALGYLLWLKTDPATWDMYALCVSAVILPDFNASSTSGRWFWGKINGPERCPSIGLNPLHLAKVLTSSRAEYSPCCEIYFHTCTQQQVRCKTVYWWKYWIDLYDALKHHTSKLKVLKQLSSSGTPIPCGLFFLGYSTLGTYLHVLVKQT